MRPFFWAGPAGRFTCPIGIGHVIHCDLFKLKKCPCILNCNNFKLEFEKFVALLIIPIRVKEKMEVILQKDEGQGILSPTILWSGATLKDSMNAVVADNERVCETNHILLAYKVYSPRIMCLTWRIKKK